MRSDFDQLISWFAKDRRDLPWRRLRTPYAIWVSEVMLQQTQVSVVIPYFNRWMERFPTVHALSEAPIDEVVKLWEGLGYYSRARNLHAGACAVVSKWGGELPRAEEALLSIKGMGPYTVSAVRAFAFGERVVAVDGNVARVGARYLGIEEEISKQRVKREIGNQLEPFLPHRSPELATEALIELGATLCLPRRTDCDQCPLHAGCRARGERRQLDLPNKGKRVETTLLRRLVPILCSGDQILVTRGEPGRVMADLYHFPYIEWADPEPSLSTVFERVETLYGLRGLTGEQMESVTHSFTRYRATLLPWRIEVASAKPVDGCIWKTVEACRSLPFVSGHRTLLRRIVS